MRMAMPLTRSAKKLRVWTQWVTRTRTECRSDSRTSELWIARPGTYAESPMRMDENSTGKGGDLLRNGVPACDNLG